MTGQKYRTTINSNPDFPGRNPGPSEKQASTNANLFRETPLVRRKKLAENMAKGLFLLMTLLIVIPLILIVFYLFYKAFPVLSIDFLFSNPARGMRAGGIWAPLLGTIYLVMISLLVSAPIGVLAAVYLNEYAGDNWLTRIINLAVVNLAGVPSIVHALFGVGAFVLFARMGRSILAASLTLAIMTLPVIIAATKEALGAVPMAFREACWNVGATRWQTIRRIVLPNSISGILTGIILQVSRAAGETAPIMFTGAVFYKAISEGDIFAYGLFDQCMALSMHLFTISTQVPNVPEAIPYGTAVVLLGTVLMVNILAIALRVYLRSRKKW
jgi:phosphate transport system permease protein